VATERTVVVGEAASSNPHGGGIEGSFHVVECLFPFNPATHRPRRPGLMVAD
jgi:hypothetical protein